MAKSFIVITLTVHFSEFYQLICAFCIIVEEVSGLINIRNGYECQISALVILIKYYRYLVQFIPEYIAQQLE